MTVYFIRKVPPQIDPSEKFSYTVIYTMSNMINNIYYKG